MATAELRVSNDQKKLILAIGLGIAAIIALWWTLFGFGASSKPKSNVAGLPSASPPPDTRSQRTKTDDDVGLTPDDLRPINYPGSSPVVPEARRNVFAFYVPPPPAPSPPPPPQTPTPTPPVLLAAISPSNVFAGTADFSLDVTGDKFTPAVHVVIDGRELPTR